MILVLSQKNELRNIRFYWFCYTHKQFWHLNWAYIFFFFFPYQLQPTIKLVHFRLILTYIVSKLGTHRGIACFIAQHGANEKQSYSIQSIIIRLFMYQVYCELTKSITSKCDNWLPIMIIAHFSDDVAFRMQSWRLLALGMCYTRFIPSTKSARLFGINELFIGIFTHRQLSLRKSIEWKKWCQGCDSMVFVSMQFLWLYFVCNLPTN